MTRHEAVTLLIERFPILKERVDPEDLFEVSYVTYSLLAREVLENRHDDALFNDVCAFVDELANSGDDLLEEHLIIDVLEGIAEDPDLAIKLKSRIGSKAVEFLARVEREYYGRNG